MRVVSLVPSSTETLSAWGVEPVACTRFCERPDLPHVGGTKNPDVAAVVALAPDLVVLDEEENRREDAAALEAAGLRLHVTAVRALADVGPTLAGLARELGLPVPAVPDEEAIPPRLLAFVPIWRRPWMTVAGSTYAATLLGAAGMATAFAGHPDRYPTLTEDDLAGAGVDVVLAPSEPYPFTSRHTPELAARCGAPVELVDGRDLFWWGARTPAALDRLRGLAQRLAG